MRAEALRSLAALLRTEPTPVSALQRWAADLSERGISEAGSITARIKLGAGSSTAIQVLHDSFGADLDGIQFALELQCHRGLDGAALLERTARGIEKRAAAAGSIRAAIAGIRLSARLVAGLPLAFVVLTPAARAPLADPLGVTLVVTGLALALVGWVWMRKLEPALPFDHPWAAFCETTAGLMRCGSSIPDALLTSSERDGSLSSVSARVHLGATWPESLRASGDGCAIEIASVLDRGLRFGAGVASSLEDLAGRWRARTSLELEQSVRRAPVLMVLPLTLCVLPSFCLLALAPFLRALFGAR
jgi:tight adherence protein B